MPVLQVRRAIIGFTGDLYDQRARGQFTHHLRDELKFDSVEALVAQMTDDVRRASEVLGVP